jgi:DNA repair ATPase RecN
MSYLTVKFKNIRGTEQRKISFNSETIAITGDNGIGKSTIFLAIEWAFYGSSHVRDIKPHGKNVESCVKVAWDKYVVFRSTKRGRYITIGDDRYDDKEMDEHILRLFSTHKVFRSYIHLAQSSYNELLTSGLSDRESILYMHIIGDDNTIFEHIRKIKEELEASKEEYKKLKATRANYEERLNDLEFDAEEYNALDIEYPDAGLIEDLQKEFNSAKTLELENYANMRIIEELKAQVMTTNANPSELKDRKDSLERTLDKCTTRDRYVSVPIDKEEEIRQKLDKYERYLSEVGNPNEHETRVYRYKKHLEELDKYAVQHDIWKQKDAEHKNYLAKRQEYDLNAKKYAEWTKYRDAQKKLRELNDITMPVAPLKPRVVSKPGLMLECPCCAAKLMLTGDQLVSEIVSETEWANYQKDLKHHKILLEKYNIEVERYENAQKAIAELLKIAAAEQIDAPIAPALVEKSFKPVLPTFNGTVPKTLEILDVPNLDKLRKQLQAIIEVKNLQIEENLPDTQLIRAELNSVIREHSRISKIIESNAILLDKIKDYEKKITSPKCSSREIQEKINKHNELMNKREQFVKMQKVKAKYDEYVAKIAKLNKKCETQKDKTHKISALLQEVQNFFNVEVLSRLDALSTITNSLLAEFQLYMDIVFGITEKSGRYIINYSIKKDGILHKSTNFMSGGELSKLSLALTIALSTMRYTPFCLYDEIFSALSQETQLICIEVMQRHLSGRPIICIMHNHIEGLFDITKTLE